MRKTHNYPGILILEFLVYLMVLIVLTTGTTQWILTMHKSVMASGKITRNQADIHAALNLFFRDIAHAPAEKSKWLQTNKDLIMWEIDENSVSWRYKNNQLTRSFSGSQRITPVLSQVSSVAFTPYYYTVNQVEYIKNVTIELTYKNTKITQIVPLKNRVVQ